MPEPALPEPAPPEPAPPEPAPPEPAQAEPALRIERLGKRYGAVEALRNADLSIGRGEFICLLGASGCGKSTLMRIVAGFEPATTGRVVLDGRIVTGPGPDRGMVFQDYGLFPWLTVRENVGFGPKARGLKRSEVADIAERFVATVGLTRFAEAYPHQLSGGMKQRVAIARVLANDATLVLMDEPFGALDAMTRERLQDELLGIWAERRLTVLFVTHAIEEAIFLADRVIVMSPGPGHIVADERIDLPRRRDVASPEFNDVRRRLSAMLHSDHGRTATA